MSVLRILEERGLVNQIAGDRATLENLLEARKTGFYAGIDPTAPSLHLGHLLPLMVLFWLYHHGHYTVSLVGGATAKVGDPSGRLTSRANTAEHVIDSNFRSLNAQVGNLWESVIKYGARRRIGTSVGKRDILNNAEWLDNLNILTFLRMMGNGARLGAMLSRDTVKNKMEKGDGMSYSEFTYPLLQAWDWWQMYQDRSVQIQIGGGDQYGNIIAGIDAVKHIAQYASQPEQQRQWLDREGRLKDHLSPMGLTVPLLKTSSGEKFGKSAGNAVWLDRSMTSPFDLYGFLLRSADNDVERYLKLFTFVPSTEINTVMEAHRSDPGQRRAQHLLASEVLQLVHGAEEAAKTRSEHESLRAPTLASLGRSSESEDGLASANNAAKHTKLPKSLVYNTPFSRILYHAGLVGTKSEGARLIGNNGAYVATASRQSTISNEGQLEFVQIKEQKASEVPDLVVDGLLILRLGKWKVRVIEIVEDSDFDADGRDAPGWKEFKETARSKQ
ncbi:uncharacterized protein MYCFIDRAFT_27144 [Pseudocercospora fijiensis CIRAD86]|uniref:Tyrosine--tRNA ligase n=1 Tax=Pseudocercospora fijiensis (strain CIRAD86) TaxID=383855 RepID=N1QC33_PSEFD|nr:uncharacterized protein MYCFIDRAFT_27144 [Pseudocercospora fijiensis CIRAD86]EME88897.1 hypothetical protein MYCFIDRAFT_27144 [Pseudocercospora fijiensis CIRAD86]